MAAMTRTSTVRGWAMSSLPVPVSPWINTVASVGATCPMLDGGDDGFADERVAIFGAISHVDWRGDVGDGAIRLEAPRRLIVCHAHVSMVSPYASYCLRIKRQFNGDVVKHISRPLPSGCRS
jgi:hypothetical protein